MRDAFAVLFFVSVGMLFDPQAIIREPGLLFGLLGIIVLAKPLTAFLIIWFLRYSVRTAITVALALAQIGEFSFLVANEALRLGLLSADGQSVLISCALISIAANPLLFRAITPLEQWLRSKEGIWRVLSHRPNDEGVLLNKEEQLRSTERRQKSGIKTRAVIVGYGPVDRPHPASSRILIFRGDH